MHPVMHCLKDGVVFCVTNGIQNSMMSFKQCMMEACDPSFILSILVIQQPLCSLTGLYPFVAPSLLIDGNKMSFIPTQGIYILFFYLFQADHKGHP